MDNRPHSTNDAGMNSDNEWQIAQRKVIKGHKQLNANKGVQRNQNKGQQCDDQNKLGQQWNDQNKSQQCNENKGQQLNENKCQQHKQSLV